MLRIEGYLQNSATSLTSDLQSCALVAVYVHVFPPGGAQGWFARKAGSGGTMWEWSLFCCVSLERSCTVLIAQLLYYCCAP